MAALAGEYGEYPAMGTNARVEHVKIRCLRVVFICALGRTGSSQLRRVA